MTRWAYADILAATLASKDSMHILPITDYVASFFAKKYGINEVVMPAVSHERASAVLPEVLGDKLSCVYGEINPTLSFKVRIDKTDIPASILDCQKGYLELLDGCYIKLPQSDAPIAGVLSDCKTIALKIVSKEESFLAMGFTYNSQHPFIDGMTNLIACLEKKPNPR